MLLDLISCHCAKGEIPWSILALYMISLRNRDAIEDKKTKNPGVFNAHALRHRICTPGVSKQNEDSRILEFISKAHAISVVVRCKLEVLKSSGPLLIPIYTPFIYYIYKNTEAKISEILGIFLRMNRG